MKRLTLLSLCLVLALAAGAADTDTHKDGATDDDISSYLNSAPAQEQALDAAGSGLRQGAPDRKPSSGSKSAPAGADPGAGGLADPTMQQAKMVPETPPPAAPAPEKSTPETAGQSDWPSFAKSLKFTVYQTWAEVPNKTSNGHAPIPMRDPSAAYAFAFRTPKAPEGQARGAICSIAQEPWSHGQAGCEYYMWISKTPGGSPVMDACKTGPLFINVGLADSVSWHVLGKGVSPKSLGFGACVVDSDATLYFNVAAGGWTQATRSSWDNTPADPSVCDAAVPAPRCGVD